MSFNQHLQQQAQKFQGESLNSWINGLSMQKCHMPLCTRLPAVSRRAWAIHLPGIRHFTTTITVPLLHRPRSFINTLLSTNQRTLRFGSNNRFKSSVLSEYHVVLLNVESRKLPMQRALRPRRQACSPSDDEWSTASEPSPMALRPLTRYRTLHSSGEADDTYASSAARSSPHCRQE